MIWHWWNGIQLIRVVLPIIMLYDKVLSRWSTMKIWPRMEWATMLQPRWAQFVLSLRARPNNLKRSGLTWQTAGSLRCRMGFANNGSLANLKDTEFRKVNEWVFHSIQGAIRLITLSRWPTFCFSVDLGTVSSSNQPDPVVWALGLVRKPLVAYTLNDSVQNRTGYYWSTYKTIDEVVGRRSQISAHSSW